MPGDFTFGASMMLTDPLYTGEIHNVVSVPDPFQIAIAGRRYNIDLKYYKRGTISPFREARDNEAEPGEQSLNPAAAWKRTRDDLSLGAGQKWADRRTSSPRRFRKSIGVDIWGEEGIKQLPMMGLTLSSTNTNLKMLPIGTRLFYVDGSDTKFTTNADLSSPTAVTGAGTVVAITTNGNAVYVADSTGLWIHVIGGAATFTAMAGAAATYAATVLHWSNGYLWAAKDNEIKEVRADGTTNLVYTHLNSAFNFVAIAGSPSWVYAGGQAPHGITEIFKIGTETDGTLAAPIYAGGLQPGEILHAMTYTANHVILGTSRGVRIAEIASDGSLDIGPVIEIDEPVTCFAVEGEFVWFGWSGYEGSAAIGGTGRLNLQEFTAPNVPAYATDVIMNLPAVFKTWGDTISIARWNGVTYFAASGNGFTSEVTGNGLAAAEIYYGRFRRGTYEPKVFLGVECVHEDLMGTTELFVTSDDAEIFLLGEHDHHGGNGLGEIFGLRTVPDSHDWYEPHIALNPDISDPTLGPTVLRMTVRALPTPKIVEEIRVPIILHQAVNLEVGEGQEQHYDTAYEYEFLRNLVRLGEPVTYHEGRTQIFATVRQVEWAESLIDSWNIKRTGLQGILLVTLVTAEM